MPLQPHEYNWVSIILFGSRLYGTHTTESDYDYKIVYMPDMKTLVLNKKDIMKSVRENDEELKIECEYMSLHKFIKLAIEGQILAFDMLWAPPNYQHDAVTRGDLWEQIIENRKDFITKHLFTFVQYAYKQAKKYGIKGSRIDVMKRCIDYIEKQNSNTYIHSHIKFFELLAQETDLVKIIKTDHNEFVEVCGKKFICNTKLKQILSSLIPYYNKFGKRAIDAHENKGVDFKAISHAFRAVRQINELLEFENIVFPLKDAKFLTDVKCKKYDYNLLEDKLIDEIDEVKNKIYKFNLKDKPNLDWDQFLLDAYRVPKVGVL